MARIVDRADVQRLQAEGCALIEVLPRKEYARVHIAGAVNVPLVELYPFSALPADKRRSIVVYCYDFQ